MSQPHTLRYRTANGQDSAPLIAALRRAGYDAGADTAQGQQRVVISPSARGDLDKEHVRSVIEEANTTSVFDGIDVSGPVRFEGEA